IEAGDVGDLQPTRGGQEEVAELHGAGPDVRHIQGGGQLRVQRVVQVHDDQPGLGGDVGDVAGERDVARAVQDAARVPGERALQVVVGRVAVGQRIHVDEDEAFLGVGDDRVVIDRMER